MTTEIEYWQTVLKTLRSYRAAQVMITCVQLDIFAQLADSPQTNETLATKTKTDPNALARLLNAAVALGLLAKEADTYANTPLTATCLAREGPYYLGHMSRLEGSNYQRWSYLTQAVQTGQRPEANIHGESQTNWVRDFELAMYDLSRVPAPLIAEALELPPNRPVKVLDVGGGHGGYSMALVRRYPNIEATVFELPAAAEVARDIIAAAGMADQVIVQAGDFQQDELGHGYDLVLLFGVLVSETIAGKLALLRKSHAALVPGGRVAVYSFRLNEARTGLTEAALFSLHMLLSNDVGDLATPSEMTGWLIEAGFEQPRLVDLPDWLNSSLFLADKPKN